jgi:hypothetical protein
MALFFRVHAVVCLKKYLTPPTLLEMGMLRHLSDLMGEWGIHLPRLS